MKMMNETPVASNQDAFDRAWDRLVTNFHLGRCAIASGATNPDGTPNMICLYRTWNSQGEVTNACVVGWMLPDTCDWHQEFKGENWRSDLLNLPVKDAMERVPSVRAQLAGAHRQLLNELQRVHDLGENWQFISHMTLALSAVAEAWKLKLPAEVPSVSVANVEAAKQMTFPNG